MSSVVVGILPLIFWAIHLTSVAPASCGRPFGLRGQAGWALTLVSNPLTPSKEHKTASEDRNSDSADKSNTIVKRRFIVLVISFVVWALSVFLPRNYVGGRDPEPAGIICLWFGLGLWVLTLFRWSWGWWL